MDGWHYKVSDSEHGPVSLEKLIELAKDQTLKHDDLVRFGVKGQWRRVGSIGQLMAHLPYELPGSQKSQFGSTMFPPNPPPSSSDTIPVTKLMTLQHSDSKEFDRGWWCRIQNREYGPLDLSKLNEWVASGRLHRDDQVRFGNDPFIYASELDGLFPDDPTPIVPPVQKAS